MSSNSQSIIIVKTSFTVTAWTIVVSDFEDGWINTFGINIWFWQKVDFSRMFVFQIALSSRNQFISEFWEKPVLLQIIKQKFYLASDLLIYAVKMTIRTVDILKVLNFIRFLLSMISLINSLFKCPKAAMNWSAVLDYTLPWLIQFKSIQEKDNRFVGHRTQRP